MKIVLQVKTDEKGNNRCFLSLDKEGLIYLRDMLGEPHLRKKGDHVHLFTEEWGGYGLDSRPYFEGCPVIHHLELYYLGQENEPNG